MICTLRQPPTFSAAQSDRIVQIGYHKRYDPGFRYAREQVKQMRDLGFVRITVLQASS